MSDYGIFRDRYHAYTVRYPKDEINEAVDEVYRANITGVIGTMDKSDALVGWAKREVAKAAVRNADMLAQMVAQTPVKESTLAGHPAVAFLKGIPGYMSDKAAALGTSLHAVGEALGKGLKPDVDEETRPLAEAYYRGFIQRYRPKFHPDYVEFMVASVEYGYAGTMDMACRIGDDIWLLDIKTSSKPITPDSRGFPYSETALQLAAGRWADFAGKPNDPKRYPIPQATRFGVVAVNQSACELVEYNVTPRDFEAFLALRTAWAWKQERKPEVKVGFVNREAA